jgi:cell division initiation protein
MRLTPVEIRQHRFNSRLRGFDRSEVEAFLEAVVSDFEEVVRENAQLRREAERLGRELDAYRSREQTIQATLTTAQQIVEELKHTAIKEAEVKVGQAEMEAEKLVREAEDRRASVHKEITELRHLRSRAEADLRRTLEGYLSLIDAHREARAAREEKPPRRAAAVRPSRD